MSDSTANSFLNLSSLGPALSALIIYLLPINDINLKMNIGFLFSELWRIVTSLNFRNFWKKSKYNEIQISQFLHEDMYNVNPIYEELNRKLFAEQSHAIKQQKLCMSNKKINCYFPNDYSKTIELTWRNQKIQVSQFYKDIAENHTKRTEITIVLASKTLSVGDLKDYIHEIMKGEVSQIYLYSNMGYHENPYWWRVNLSSNKTFENTFYSKKITNELIDDVDWFMNNPKWFEKRGLTYKRTYLLWGKPGLGKTSVPKIIAKKYNIPIYSVDLSKITSNAQFEKLIDSTLQPNVGKHIICFDDIDRQPLFEDFLRKATTEPSKFRQKTMDASDFLPTTEPSSKIEQVENKVQEGKVNEQCIMSFLDGLKEPNGRICILTANDVSKILKYDGLTRPGRIDKFVKFEACDKEQICKMFNLFYEQKLQEKEIKCMSEITPAELTNLMTIYDAKQMKKLLCKSKFP